MRRRRALQELLEVAGRWVEAQEAIYLAESTWMSEETAIGVVRKRGIEATIIGEECGKIEGKEGYVIIDAIDGTTNAISGIPFYCCSVAYATDFYLSAVVDSHN